MSVLVFTASKHIFTIEAQPAEAVEYTDSRGVSLSLTISQIWD